ncbi:glutaminyl-tRNA synthetase [Xylona heveae TC161]|uniref:glutamine--tRNA ligase n=1 Tax=Xylona heveae (strain CBS 132557 / TC161) TaxID=1328760 RepID=A0A161TC58_XYLHT|nr:glutaminyl-tRNA synthetase [Xylona heveae TC161]KZF23337.1 glutaminyl-tRNA synthetase [Xylona heveae TC161]
MDGQTTLPERPKEPAAPTESAANNSPAVEQATKPAKAPKKPKPPKAPKAPKEPKPPAQKKQSAPNVPAPPADPNSMFKEGFLKAVHAERPAERVFTRFPPEPNGYLHIGHSKAIAINFGFARYHGGDCYLRFDDTNPEAEEEKYFVAIREMIEWLGFKPYKVTYSSDNFDKLYELAEELIRRDRAYVCHCSDTEVKQQRGGENHGPRYACVHRSRPTEESLQEFRAMRDGKYKPREAFLRMKQNLEDGNPQMWDLSAYRVLNASHHRTGDKWCIYPTYDFTHCLCDSFENISHSLCTTEFQLSRVSYEWLCDELDVYKPMQREYGRLNVTGTVLSKRKIAKLVNEHYVRGWDDPRLYTLVALRRRGVPPGAILSFINELGVSTALTNIQLARFEQSVRRYLETTVPRLMVVLDPIPVVIENLPDGYVEEVEVPFSPKDPSMGGHVVPFTKVVYVDRSDFREIDSKDYFRLAPGKSVGLLKVPYPIKATTFSKDPTTGLVTEVRAVYEKPEEGATFKKPKTYIQWVGSSEKHHSPVKVEARMFYSLFRSENPDATEGGFINDINPDSEQIFPNAMVETGLDDVRKRAPWPQEEGEKNIANKDAGYETVRFQGLRIAYFCLDKDSTSDKLVLNRIVGLKEDAAKSS